MRWLRQIWCDPWKSVLSNLSRLNSESSTSGNDRVTLSGSRFFRLHPRTPKAYDILTRLEDNLLPKVQNIKYIKIFEENSTAFRLKHRYPPTQEKQFITPHSHQWETISMSNQKKHNIIFRPNSYVGGRQKILYYLII